MCVCVYVCYGKVGRELLVGWFCGVVLRMQYMIGYGKTTHTRVLTWHPHVDIASFRSSLSTLPMFIAFFSRARKYL